MLISQIVPARAQAEPSAPAITCGDHHLTYEDLHRQASRLAQAFVKHGLRPGDRVALCARPCHRFALAEVATVAAGGVPLAVFPRFAPPERQHLMGDADPTILVYSQEFAEMAQSLTCSSLRLRVSFDAAGTVPTIDELIEQHPPLPQWHEGAPDDVALLVYTSGTTGKPKGVMHTHRSWASVLGLSPTILQGPIPMKTLNSWHLYHVSGQTTLWATLFHGGEAVFTPRVSVPDIVALVERERITDLPLVGTFLKDAVDYLHEQRRTIPGLRRVSHGGAPASTVTLSRALQVFPAAAILEIYGSTETGTILSSFDLRRSIEDGKDQHILSVGRAIPQAHVRFVDEADRDVRRGQVGEILVRSDSLAAGYWRNPEATAQAFSDGWYRTGDLGYIAEDGYIFLVDRKKDLIIVGSLNVYSVEVEAILSLHPAVRECAVVSAPKADEGEEVLAATVLNSGHGLNLDELSAHCHDRLADYKIPTRLDLVEQLPKTGIGKIDKQALKDKYWAGRDRRIN